jgi:hypothetical protein
VEFRAFLSLSDVVQTAAQLEQPGDRVRILQDKGNERDFNELADGTKDKGAIPG